MFGKLRLLQLKMEGQTIKTEHLTKSYRTELKILANPGLAQSGFEQPWVNHIRHTNRDDQSKFHTF